MAAYFKTYSTSPSETVVNFQLQHSEVEKFCSAISLVKSVQTKKDKETLQIPKKEIEG